MMYGDRVRPELPKPACRVMLVCGPPAAGKSTYVRVHARPSDSVIDVDMIAREFGYDRDRPPGATAMLLDERNDRLAALADAPADHVAWVIVGAPSVKLRAWWCEQLNVAAADLILLAPPRAELVCRIMNDPDRAEVWVLHTRLIDQWLQRENNNDPGYLTSTCNADGWPSDPLHPWNISPA